MQLGQEGGGHYLPVMAYNIKYDYALIFDCARYKYNSRWHKVKILFEAQTGKDRVTNLSRGFIIAIKNNNKIKNYITKDKIIDINKQNIENFLNQIKFNTLLDLANILNWLIINEFIVDNNALWNERKYLWEKIIPDFYQNNKK